MIATSRTILTMAGSLLLAAGTAAAQIHVPGDHPTIQAAIDAAEDGDEIIVAPGTYEENINLSGKAIHLHSSDGPEQTTIDAGGNGTVVTAASGEGADTILEGFTITGGNASEGGGMRNQGASPTIVNCIFKDNTATHGGAISNNFSGPTIENCVFLDNTASSTGGGVRNISFSVIVVSGSSFENNTAADGGAVWSSATTTCAADIDTTFFCGNQPEHISGDWHDEGGNEFLDKCPDDPIPGDLTGNGKVTGEDLGILLSQWGPCDDCDDCPADLTGNCEVGGADLGILLSNWS